MNKYIMGFSFFGFTTIGILGWYKGPTVKLTPPIICSQLKADERGCMTIIGYLVPDTGMKTGGVRIGSGNVYLDITADGKSSISGANADQAVEKVLEGIGVALRLNPNLCRRVD